MNVETLTARLEVSGLAGFTTQLAAADRTTGGMRDQLDKLAAISKIATEALSKIKMTAAQAAETSAVAEAIKRSVSSVTDAANKAADHLADVKLSQAQAVETRLAADEQVRSLKKVEDQAIRTRAATGGRGLAGVGAGVLLPAAIGLGIAAAPALGPAALGLAGAGLVGGATLIGAGGTAYAALSGLSTALAGDKKAFDALNPAQQQFVQTLRSINTGLKDVASNALLPGLTKALHDMFTPGLVQAMTVAVRAFGTAMGDAGQIVGRYFGSNQFTSLMKAIAPQAAAGIKDFARIFVSMADALGHVTQAALPLTRWLGDTAAKSASLFDSWIKGEQASGGLAHAFDLAKQSLQAIGGLLSSTAGAVHALLNAIGGFSTGTAVINLLKRALDGLSAFFTANRAVLSNVFSGLVKSANDAITVIGGILKALHPLLSLINAIAKDFGGWRPIIDAVTTVLVAKMALSIGWVGRLAKTLVGVGPAAAAGATEAEGALTGIGAAARAALGPVGLLLTALSGAYLYYKFLTSHQPAAGGPGQGVVQPTKGGTIYAIGGGHVAGMNYPGAQAAAAARLGVTLNPTVSLPHGVGGNAATGAGNLGPPLPSPHVPQIFGTPPPFTTNLGGGGGGGAATGIPAIGNAATTLGQLAAHFATLATTLNNAGVKAKQYLIDEQKALEKELAALPAASGKNAAAIKAAAATINNQLITVGVQIKDALDKTGAALIPKNLRTIMASQTAQFTADSAYQQSLTGQVASDYGKVLMGDLTAQRVTLTDEIAKLKSQLNGATAKQKANINTEIAALQTQMTSLNNSIISQIESTINSLQSSLGNIFNSVQSELDTQLGNLYYQNGLLTPSEALLQSMQSADQLNSLNQSLAQAQTTLANDQSTLAKRVLDVSTGKITNVYDPKNAAQIAADQQAVTQAQRALDEYNLQIKATQERTYYDNAYTTQVAALNRQLAAWETAVMNGQEPIKSLSAIASSFGLTINQNLVPDFFGPDGLDAATKNLKQAFKDLIAYIGTLTGKTPQDNGGGGGSGSVSIPGGQSIPGPFLPAAQAPGQSLSNYLAGIGIGGAMAGGGSGRVTRPTLFLAGEAGAEDFAFSGGGQRFGGGGGINFTLAVSALDPGSVDWNEVAKKATPAFRRELIRLGTRNGGTTKNLLGTT